MWSEERTEGGREGGQIDAGGETDGGKDNVRVKSRWTKRANTENYSFCFSSEPQCKPTISFRGSSFKRKRLWVEIFGSEIQI